MLLFTRLGVLLRICDYEFSTVSAHHPTRIPRLASTFRIKHRLIGDNHPIVRRYYYRIAFLKVAVPPKEFICNGHPYLPYPRARLADGSYSGLRLAVAG